MVRAIQRKDPKGRYIGNAGEGISICLLLHKDAKGDFPEGVHERGRRVMALEKIEIKEKG